MRKLGCFALVLLVVFGLVLGAFWRVQRAGTPVSVSPVVRETGRGVEPEPVATRARPATVPDPVLLRAATKLLGSDLRQERCGPYPLFTDVHDARLIEACGRLASQLDSLYEERYGVRPVGEPAEAIVLFSEIGAYREFAREGGVPLGYAGYAVAARGLAVFYAGGQPIESFVTTVAHELTHLVHRRALGVNLPPWLSEGLADGLGDTATAGGFKALRGVVGSEAQAWRLEQAVISGQAGKLRRLVALRRGEFDSEPVAFDYEQSALLVRFLLADPELARGFRSFLRDLAQNGAATPEALSAALGVSWEELDRRFVTWLRQAAG